jgi:hypothetical protein
VIEGHLGDEQPSRLIDLAVPPLAVTDRGRRRRAGVLVTAAFAVVIAGGAGYARLRPADPPAAAVPAAVPSAEVPETAFVLRPRPVADPPRRRP